ncbi:MAG: lipopolysaccharide heptosyltransferase II [Planctomycetota bacterium]
MSRSADPRRILLIKPSSLGDVVHALPVLAALRRAWPQAHIAWLVNSAFAPLLERHPLLDETIVFDRRTYGRMLRSRRAAAAFIRFARDLRARQFDLVVDLQGLFRSGFLSWASGAPQRVGFAGAREFAWLFYTRRIRPPAAARHAVDRNVHLARALDLPVTAEFPLPVAEDERRSARALLQAAAGRPVPHFLAVLPGARWESKRWPAARFADLIEDLSTYDSAVCVLLGAPDERPCATEILARCKAPLIDLVGRTSLPMLVALLAEADLVISNDSGPLHLAAALHRPLVALFGPTSPARTGPYSDTARVVQRPLPCAPCFRRRCPLGHHDCLQGLPVDAVLHSVRELRWTGHPPAQPSLP